MCRTLFNKTPQASALPLRAAAFDAALHIVTIEHLPEPGRALAEIARVLKPGARLLFAEPAGHVTASLFEAELQAARDAGFTPLEAPSLRRSRSALLEKARA